MTKWSETDRINLLAIVVSKLTNLAMCEATFSVESTSAQADGIKELCKNLEEKRFEITSKMLGEGDCLIFPANNVNGGIIHTIADAEHFRIADMDGDELTEVYGIIDEYSGSDGKQYKLIRHHKLEANGDLHVEIYTVNNNWERTTLEKWKPLETDYVFYGAGHIGAGRYKSPVSDRGNRSAYGKPLNYGCGDIEDRILTDIENRDNEMNNGRSILFADERILDKAKESGTYKISENVFAMRTLAGNGVNSNIDVYNPALRIGEYNSKLAEDLSLYEAQLGLSKGILSDATPTNSATATEINVANASTVSMLNGIQNAIDRGNIGTLMADSILLGVPFDIWSYSSDYYNPFENPEAQFNRLIAAVEKGAAEKSDVTAWLFPKMTDDEIAEKLAKISEGAEADTAAAIERALAGA